MPERLGEDNSTRLPAELVSDDVVAPLATMRKFMAAYFQATYLIEEGRLAEALEPALLASMFLGELAPEISFTLRGQTHRSGQKASNDRLYGELRVRACEMARSGVHSKTLSKAADDIASQLFEKREELGGQALLGGNRGKTIERYLKEGLTEVEFAQLFPRSARAQARELERKRQMDVEKAYVTYRLQRHSSREG